jgi:hypothetical protein
LGGLRCSHCRLGETRCRDQSRGRGEVTKLKKIVPRSDWLHLYSNDHLPASTLDSSSTSRVLAVVFVLISIVDLLPSPK